MGAGQTANKRSDLLKEALKNGGGFRHALNLLSLVGLGKLLTISGKREAVAVHISCP